MDADKATRIERALTNELGRGRERGVFPGAAACAAVWAGSEWRFFEQATGVLGENLGPVAPGSIFDLASLTKPYIAMAALRLHQRGGLGLGTEVGGAIAEAVDLPVGKRTWEQVLSHRSGLEAWSPFYETVPHPSGSREARNWLLGSLLPRMDEEQVGTAVYSDLGYILAGFALERVTRDSLGSFVADELAGWGVDDEVFFGALRDDDIWIQRCAPTGRSEWRQQTLRGQVNDDNCAILGGVAGHAGMFGTARAVARFGASCVSALHGRIGAESHELMQHAVRERPGGSHRLGWDGVVPEGSAAGSRISKDGFGHLGFTGTSIWCDPRQQAVVVLLTNRVAVSDDNSAIRAFRPAFHDAIFAALKA